MATVGGGGEVQKEQGQSRWMGGSSGVGASKTDSSMNSGVGLGRDVGMRYTEDHHNLPELQL